MPPKLVVEAPVPILLAAMELTFYTFQITSTKRLTYVQEALEGIADRMIT